MASVQNVKAQVLTHVFHSLVNRHYLLRYVVHQHGSLIEVNHDENQQSWFFFY